MKEANRGTLHAVGSIGHKIGGPPRSVTQLAKYTALLGSRVSLISGVWEDDPIVPIDPTVSFIPVPGTRVKLGGIRLAGSYRAALRKSRLVRDIDVVHLHGIWILSSMEVSAYSRKLNKKLVISPRGMLEPWALERNRLKKRLVWWMYQRRDLQKASAFHATSRQEAESIRRIGMRQPIAVIPNGIEMPVELDSPTRKGVRKRALFLSRIHPKKGILMLLEAWKAVNPNNWELVIAGNDEGDFQRLVEERVRAYGLEDQVSLPGPLYNAEKEAAFRQADLFILPSHSENFGIVVAEALSYGVPVLTTKGCPWEELPATGSGWWVEPSVAGLQTGLSEALRTSRVDLTRMGKRGKALAKQNYQWPEIARKMNMFYAWITKGGTTPPFVL